MEAHKEHQGKVKLIFLDFDGVLNSYRTVWAAPGDENGWMPEHLDPVAIGLVRKLCELTGAKIVISSSWRIEFSIEQLKEILATKGWKDAPIIGHTMMRFSHRYRGEEVAYWLEDFEAEGNEVESYVILDDNAWFWTEPREGVGKFYQNQPFVKTDELEGMSIANFYSALLLLDPNHEKLVHLEYLLGYKS
jgi:hypothetical protein